MRNDDGADYRPKLAQKFVKQARINNAARARELELFGQLGKEILDQAIDVLFQKQEEVLKELRLHFDNENKKLLRPYEQIERRLCAVFHVTPKEIRSHRRSKEIMLARQAVMYWAIRLTGYSYPKIGRIMGERDHTSIMSGVTAYRQKREKMGRYLRKAR